MLRRRQVLKQQYFSLSLWLLLIMKIAIIIAEKKSSNAGCVFYRF